LGAVLQLVRATSVSDEKEISFEALAPPTMTPDLAIALAQLLRTALARRSERHERVA
jgi:hypothetical protein